MQLNSIRVKLFFVSICCLVLSLSVGCEKTDSDKTPVVSAPPATTFPMPPISGKSLSEMGWQLADGQRNNFAQYNGSVLVLDFYATWCMPCRESVPHLIELQRRYENDVRVVGLNVGGVDDLTHVSEFAKELSITYPLGLPDNDLVSLLITGPDQIPQTFIFDRAGKLEKRLVGFDKNTVTELTATVEKILTTHTD